MQGKKSKEYEFVLHLHSCGQESHIDLMLEDWQGSGSLVSWRLPKEFVEDNTISLEGNEKKEAVKIPNHPRRFLTYEGPLKKAAGSCKILDKGKYTIIEESNIALKVDCFGVILKGRFILEKQRDNNWSIRIPREEGQDMLKELFRKQAEFNKRTGFDAELLRKNFDPKYAGEWLNNYLMAMSNEIEELRDCMYWKHWCKEAKEGRRFEIHDLQNARVEVIDMLFFWISLAQCVGLDADDVVRLYEQKLRVNHERQDNNYSMANKTEDDNKTIML